MRAIIPPRMKAGDEIRIVAPSLAFSFLEEEVIQTAKKTLENMGFVVSFSKLCKETDRSKTDSAYERAKDLEEAFLDTNVKGILTALGGFDCHTILEHLDFSVIKNNPKVLCGHSDITSLQNAIFEQTGLVTYSGPHFSSFGINGVTDMEYTKEMFVKAVTTNDYWLWKEANKWGRYEVELDSNGMVSSEAYDNEGVVVVHSGNLETSTKNDGDSHCQKSPESERIKTSNGTKIEGTIIGGNLRTLGNLINTSYFPSLENTILFLEDDNITGGDFVREFFTNLQRLMSMPEFSKVKGIVIGRSIDQSLRNHLHLLGKFFAGNPLFSHIVVLYGLDFGHTSPMGTFSVGGDCKISIVDNKAQIWVR